MTCYFLKISLTVWWIFCYDFRMKSLIKGVLCAGFLLFAFPVMAQGRISASLIADAQSGYMFYKDNIDAQIPPASLTKLMTLYLTFGAVEKGLLKWDDKLPVSENAATQPRTNLNLYAGQTLTVRQAVDAIIVHSANDAAVVLAEALATDEEKFADMMTRMAEQLNMKQTTFKNASGLHRVGQKTTAKDMAVLTLALIQHYPQHYSLFSQKTFDLNGRTYTSHNRILNEYPGAEGMKTGYVSAGGYNLIATANQDGTRLVGVVMGQDDGFSRDTMMKGLLDKGFERVGLQKQAVANGQLSPAMDPLHRHFMLPKADITPFSFEMERSIRQALNTTIQKHAPHFNTIAKNDTLGWAIQVGAFRSKQNALQMAERAFDLLKTPNLKVMADLKESLFKAQLRGFADRGGAVQACHFLNQQNCPCILVSNS
jgi:D-alanyl-D-alanine carboxypeptidase